MRIGMQTILTLAGAWVSASAYASDDSFSGRYAGRLGEAPATVELIVSGSMVTGHIKLEAGRIDLKGTTDEGRLAGAAASGRGAGFFEAYREFGALIVIVRETGPVTGQSIETRGQFTRVEKSAANEITAPADPTQRDPDLVGVWVSRAAGRRGSIALMITTTMKLDLDGSYSRSSDPPEQSIQGEWRNDDGLLEYRAEGIQSWSALGEYQLHGDSLITILPGKDPEVWTRAD